jgi:hypothetical protein
MPEGPARQKIEQMLLYVVGQAREDRSLTRTKLAKVLWYADFGAYREWGRPLSGWNYVKQAHGPMPDKMKLIELDLEAEGRLLRHPEGKAMRYSLPKSRRGIATGLSPEEIAHLDKVIEMCRNKWATYLSNKSHQESVGWQAAAIDEVIPYSTALLSREPLSDREIARGQELAREFGLTV